MFGEPKRGREIEREGKRERERDWQVDRPDDESKNKKCPEQKIIKKKPKTEGAKSSERTSE